MTDHRVQPRRRLDRPGLICLDEHRSVSCLVYDQSEGGVRVTLPDADIIPETFLLAVSEVPAYLVCRTVWRRGEEIGAQAWAA